MPKYKTTASTGQDRKGNIVPFYNKFKCHRCQKTFKTEEELTTHETKSKNNSNLDCPKCNRLFCSKNGLTKHKCLTTYCDICDIQFRTPSKYRIHHMAKHVSEKDMFKCQYCEQTFGWKGNLLRHERLHMNEKESYTCGLCERKFLLKSLVNHTNRCHQKLREGYYGSDRGKKIPCTFEHCGKMVPKIEYALHLHQHFSNHNKKSYLPFHCNYQECDFKCSDTVIYQRHLEVHIKDIIVSTEPLKFPCPLCRKIFFSAKKKQNHVRNCGIPCDECGLRYRNMSTLKIHQRTHTKEKPFECGLCSRRFSVKSDLARHYKSIHKKVVYQQFIIANKKLSAGEINAEKLFLCKFCGYGFSKSQLKEHEESHFRKNPSHPCKKCGLGFTNDGTFRRHLKKYCLGMEKEYLCPVCEEFSTKLYEDALNHLSTCQPTRIFNCTTCSEIIHVRHVSNHLQGHLLEESKVKSKCHHACNNCDLKFPTPTSLQSHIRNCFPAEETSHVKYFCPLCSAWTKDRMLMIGHVCMDHKVKVTEAFLNDLSDPLEIFRRTIGGKRAEHECFLCKMPSFCKIMSKVHVVGCFARRNNKLCLKSKKE